MNATAHPRREQLSALVFGGLPDEEIEPLAEHVETCPECEATVQELETMADSLIDRIRQPPPVDEYADEPEFHAALANVVELKNRLRPGDETGALGWVPPDGLPARIAFDHARLVLEDWARWMREER